MDNIDPFEHPPVYKQDQVITLDDLKFLEEIYKETELKFAQMGMLQEAVQCCHTHTLMESLQDWIKNGKPREGLPDE